MVIKQVNILKVQKNTTKGLLNPVIHIFAYHTTIKICMCDTMPKIGLHISLHVYVLKIHTIALVSLITKVK